MCLLARTHVSSRQDRIVKVIFGRKSWPKMVCTNPSAKVVEGWKSKPQGSFFEAHLPITTKKPYLLRHRQFASFPTKNFPTKMLLEVFGQKIAIFSQTLNGRLPPEDSSDWLETWPKRVSDDPQWFIFWPPTFFFWWTFWSKNMFFVRKKSSATFWRIEANVPGYMRFWFRFDQILGRLSKFL